MLRVSGHCHMNIEGVYRSKAKIITRLSKIRKVNNNYFNKAVVEAAKEEKWAPL